MNSNIQSSGRRGTTLTDDLFAAAAACLFCCDITEKLKRARDLPDAVARLGRQTDALPAPIDAAGRPERPLLVEPSRLPQRGLGSTVGRSALIHAVAHIEFNAINLACDAIYRFRDLPGDYYRDWAQVAAEEAYHFGLLQRRLEQLGHSYGDFEAHNGLWDMAVKTAEDPLLRMALVPRVLEARGLDVTPGMMKRFASAGDQETADILAIILRDEIGHVEIGSRWFRYLCEARGVDPETTYLDLLHTHLGGRVRCPLHRTARRQAGFSERELDAIEALCRDAAGGRRD